MYTCMWVLIVSDPYVNERGRSVLERMVYGTVCSHHMYCRAPDSHACLLHGHGVAMYTLDLQLLS